MYLIVLNFVYCINCINSSMQKSYSNCLLTLPLVAKENSNKTRHKIFFEKLYYFFELFNFRVIKSYLVKLADRKL